MNKQLHALGWLCVCLVLAPGHSSAESPGADEALSLLQRAEHQIENMAYAPALEMLRSAYDVGVSIDNDEIARSALNSMASVSYSIGNLELAHEYFTMLVRQDESSDQRDNLAVSLFNLGHVNASQQQFKSAEENFRRSLQISRELADNSGIAYTLKVLGVNAQAQGNMASARTYLLESLQLFTGIAESQQVAAVQRHLGDVALESAEYENAIIHYAAALEKLLQEQTPGPALMRTYRGLSKANGHLHQYRDAYAFHLVYAELLHNQLQQKNQETTQRLQVQFETRRLFDDNERLRLLSTSQQSELQHHEDVQQMQYAVIVLALGIVILIGALWYRSRENARKMARLATTDVLTGLLNRRALIQHGEYEWKRAERFERTMSCLLFDIDHFKSINDTLGHAAGDQVLSQVASVVKSSLRTMDVLGRFGGEEFLLIAAETDVDEAGILAERIRHEVESTSYRGIPDRKVTVSIGIAQLTNEITLDQLIAHADQAMYAAKDAGRNRINSYRPRDHVPATTPAPTSLRLPLSA